MKASTKLAGIVLGCFATTAMASDLTLTLTTTGSTTVAPSAVVPIEISGLLSDSLNEGLALFGVDMTASGPAAIDLSTAAAISAGINMSNFVSPDGLNNPTACGGCFGFGGTASGNDLLQIGGGMNTIGNTIGNAPFPIGTVDTGLGQASEILATGTITMPATEGVYTISLQSGFANVITLGEVGPTVYATEAAGTVSTVDLIITVAASGVDITNVVSLSDHGGSILPLDIFSGNDVEPRATAFTELEIIFNGTMDPLTTIAANVSITGASSGPFGGLVSTSLDAGQTVLTITLDARVADVDCHTISLAGMQSSGGGGVTNPSFSLTALQGDIDRNGIVSTGDASIIKPHFGEAVDASNLQFDHDSNGVISTGDASIVKPLFGNAAGGC